MNRIKNLFNFEMWRNVFGGGTSKVLFLSGVFAAAGFILPLLLGISAGWLGSVYIEYSLASKSSQLRLSMATNAEAVQSKRILGNGLTDFLSANPFSISSLMEDVHKVLSTPVSKDNTEVKKSFATAALVWTFPEIGACVQDNTNNKVGYIPIGESFEEYELTKVFYDRAIFRDEENNDITKFLYLVEKEPKDRTQPGDIQPMKIIEPAAYQDIIPAVPNGQSGVIAQELINDMINNPFEEMKRFRLRPSFVGNEPVGIEFQWIQNDSLLGKLGVVKGDVLKSINGISMKNMGDMVNSINSLINGKRFDVEVLRGNTPINLSYVVR
jgi:type II secretory pathway component PulC